MIKYFIAEKLNKEKANRKVFLSEAMTNKSNEMKPFEYYPKYKISKELFIQNI